MLIEFCQKPSSLNDLHINSGDSWKVVVLILQTWLAGFLPLVFLLSNILHSLYVKHESPNRHWILRCRKDFINQSHELIKLKMLFKDGEMYVNVSSIFVTFKTKKCLSSIQSRDKSNLTPEHTAAMLLILLLWKHVLFDSEGVLCYKFPILTCLGMGLNKSEYQTKGLTLFIES